jgi:hypothetical protein
MYADQGDITLDSPEAFLLKTSGLDVAAIMTPCSRLETTRAPVVMLVARHPDVIW